MNFLKTCSDWFLNNILTQPEFFVGLIVLIGYILLKKPIYESIAGFIKATVGYMLLNVGAAGLVVTFRPILAGLNGRFNLDAAVIDPYFGLGAVNDALEKIGQTTSVTMQALLIGFILNIVLVLFRRITKVRTLFITGHIMVQQATTIIWIVFYLFPEYRNITGTAIAGVLSGLYWGVGANLTVEATQRLTGGAGFAIGHQQALAIWATDKLSPKVGNKKKRLDDIKLPKSLGIFHDNVISTSVLMLVFFGLIMVILGPDTMHQIDKGFKSTVSFPIYIISCSLKFTVYLQILMTGVRMFVAELTQAFQGISNRILPGSLPAVDCAAAYSFASPNSILVGFVSGAIAQFITIILLIVFKSPILIITGFVPVFFDNATIAAYADKRGGARAAVILSAASGVIQVLGGAIACVLLSLSGGWHGNIDFDTFWPAAAYIFKYAGIIGVGLVIIFLLIIPQLQFYFAKNKENYYNAVVEPEED